MGNLGQAFGEGAVIAITIKAIDEFSKGIDSVEKGITGLSKKTEVMATAFVSAGIAAVGVMGKLAVEGAIADDVIGSFNKTVGDDYVWKTMQKNLLGTVDKYKLMSIATTSVSRGINKEFLPTIADFAQRLSDSDSQFKDTIGTMNDLSTAIATGRTMTLARMGIIVDAKTVEETYAQSVGKVAKDLTEQEKQMALTNAIMDQLTTKTEGMVVPTEDAADKMSQLNTKFIEAKTQMGIELAPAFSDLIDKIMPMIPQLSEIATSLIPTFVKGLQITTVTIGLVSDGITGLTAAFSILKIGAIATITGVVMVFQGLLHIIDGVINGFIGGINKVIGAYMSLPKKLRIFGNIETIGNVYLSESVDKQVEELKSLLAIQEKEFKNIAAKETITKIGDAIIRPNGQIITTDPADYLIATKNPNSLNGGISITITGDIYGVNPDNIANALVEKLKRKILI